MRICAAKCSAYSKPTPVPRRSSKTRRGRSSRRARNSRDGFASSASSRAHAALPAGASQSFSSARELAKLTAEWPASRLMDTWNSFAGVAPFDKLKPVKKFTSGKAAVARIWTAVVRLSPDSAQPAEDVAPAKGKAKKSPTKVPRRARVQKGAKGDAESRSNKKAEVIALMKRGKGVTLSEIVETTGWQKHTVRGFVSILGSKGGEKIESSKNAAEERSYRIAK
jgi:Protein of unknown function (DUF3489)